MCNEGASAKSVGRIGLHLRYDRFSAPVPSTEPDRFRVFQSEPSLSRLVGLLPNMEVRIMKSMKKVLLGATAGAAILAASAITASAAIVCTGNVCWHTPERHTYPPAAGVVIHEDDWRAGPGITFREHEGRGYWKGDTWTDF
jgi:hypothetical protein